MFNPEPNATVTLSPLLSFEFLSSAGAVGAVEARPAASRRPKPIHRSIEILIVSLPSSQRCASTDGSDQRGLRPLSAEATPPISDALKTGLFPLRGNSAS